MCNRVCSMWGRGRGDNGFVLMHRHSFARPRVIFNFISMQQSHLSDWLGSQLKVLGKLPHPVIALFISAMVASVTEIMSNIATTTLFLPVLRDLVIVYTPHAHAHVQIMCLHVYRRS